MSNGDREAQSKVDYREEDVILEGNMMMEVEDDEQDVTETDIIELTIAI